MDILSSRMISLKTKIQIMHFFFFFFCFKMTTLKVKYTQPKQTRWEEERGKEYSKGQVSKTERTIRSKYNHPFSPKIYLFNTNINMYRTDEWATREGKAKAFKCCSLETSLFSKRTACSKSVNNSNRHLPMFSMALWATTGKGRIECCKTQSTTVVLLRLQS